MKRTAVILICALAVIGCDMPMGGFNVSPAVSEYSNSAVTPPEGMGAIRFILKSEDELKNGNASRAVKPDVTYTDFNNFSLYFTNLDNNFTRSFTAYNNSGSNLSITDIFYLAVGHYDIRIIASTGTEIGAVGVLENTNIGAGNNGTVTVPMIPIDPLDYSTTYKNVYVYEPYPDEVFHAELEGTVFDYIWINEDGKMYIDTARGYSNRHGYFNYAVTGLDAIDGLTAANITIELITRVKPPPHSYTDDDEYYSHYGRYESLKKDNTAYPINLLLNPTKRELESGYYYITMTLERVINDDLGTLETVELSQVLHIYPNLTSVFSYKFENGNNYFLPFPAEDAGDTNGIVIQPPNIDLGEIGITLSSTYVGEHTVWDDTTKTLTLQTGDAYTTILASGSSPLTSTSVRWGMYSGTIYSGYSSLSITPGQWVFEVGEHFVYVNALENGRPVSGQFTVKVIEGP